uniref:50S ribosome-binding GTPase n=1 Tax=Candidatus Kentrum sp. TC TaxID=2126339 RepID=A0A450YD92_9GAMM|nr:MAG: 50S ribosome-binding GTPase [Candidatus Kentron sp. TC]
MSFLKNMTLIVLGALTGFVLLGGLGAALGLEFLTEFLTLEAASLVALWLAITAVITTYHEGKRAFPISHMVSFIGYPRSGKTTLITALFSEVFAQRILRGVNIIPRGAETIERVNEDIARLETGRELAPTTAQDLFSYRVEMLTGKTSLSRRYKIEIGDFPGEDSENLANKDAAWLHKTKYFQWALNADVFIFVIDLENLTDLGDDRAREYKSLLERSFRAAWQRIKEHHYDGARKLRNNPVILAFTKADLLLDSENSYRENSAASAGNAPGNYHRPVVLDSKERNRELSEKQESIEAYFRDIIQYLGSETSRFHVIFTSAFAKEKPDSVRFGIEELARSVLPK